jgi:general secretion pathway protein G
MRSLNKQRCAGFTLVELLVVIFIIALLMALVLAGVLRAWSVGKNADNDKDLRLMASSAAQFNLERGQYPPSRITLAKFGGQVKQIDPQSYATMEALFPEAMDTWNTTGIDWLPGQPGPVMLEGHQCLVFFLGGIPVNGVCTGFSSNPANPALPRTPGEKRRGPYYPFDPSRLKPMANGCLAYLDAFGQPYAYFCANGSNNYNANDCASLGLAPYRLSATEYVYPDTFQLISGGGNAVFGPGGLYDPKTIAAGPGRDDIANFAAGPLGAK